MEHCYAQSYAIMSVRKDVMRVRRIDLKEIVLKASRENCHRLSLGNRNILLTVLSISFNRKSQFFQLACERTWVVREVEYLEWILVCLSFYKITSKECAKHNSRSRGNTDGNA